MTGRTTGWLLLLLCWFFALQTACAEEGDSLTCNGRAQLVYAINPDGPGKKVLVLNASSSATIKATVAGTYLEDGKTEEIRVTRTLRPGLNAYVGTTVNQKPGLGRFNQESAAGEDVTRWKIADCTTH